MDPRIPAEIQQRFGHGPVARRAMQQALAQTDQEFDDMFRFTNPVPSGLQGRQDHLHASAAEVLGTQSQQPMPSPGPPPSAEPPLQVSQPGAAVQMPARYQQAIEAAHSRSQSPSQTRPDDQPRPAPPQPYQSPVRPQHPATAVIPPPYARADSGSETSPAHHRPVRTVQPTTHAEDGMRAANPPQAAPTRSPQQTAAASRPQPAPAAGPGTGPQRIPLHAAAAELAVTQARARRPTHRPGALLGRAMESAGRDRAHSPQLAPEHVSMSTIMRLSGSQRPTSPEQRSLSARITGQPAYTGRDAQAFHTQFSGTGGTGLQRPGSAQPGVSTRLTTPPRHHQDARHSSPGSGSPSPGRGVPMSPGRRRGTQPAAFRTGMPSPSGTRSGSPDALPVRRQHTPRGAEGAGWQPDGTYLSHGAKRADSTRGEREARRDRAEEYFYRYRLKQHMNGAPDFRFSQPSSEGVMVTVGQQPVSFDTTHPAVADQHYMRTSTEDVVLQQERERAQTRSHRRSRSLSPSPARSRETQRLTKDVTRLQHAREMGQQRLQELEQEGADVRDRSREVSQRAMDVLAASERITKRHQSHYGSRSPSQSRSPSPSPARYSPRPMTSHRPRSPADHLQRAPEEPFRLPQQGVQDPAEAWGGMSWDRDAAVQAGAEYMQEQSGGSLADYVARDSGVRLHGDPQGPALTEEEFKMASGVFDPQKFDEYNRQMDLEMERRAQEGGFDSDEERERQAAEAVAYENLTEHQRAELERQAREQMELEALLHQAWEEQDQWMDYYRERLGPREGYRHSTSGPLPQALLVDMHSPPSTRGNTQHASGAPRSEPGSALSPQDEQLAEEHFVPMISSDLMQQGYYDPTVQGTTEGYASDGPRGYRPVRRQQERFTPTKPRPFAFEQRAANKPKSIMQVKGEQDLALRKQEEAAAKRYRFKANPVPMSTTTSKYADQLLMAEVRRQINRDTRLAELTSMMEKPFSFQERDEYQARQKEAVVTAAKDPNRFQIPFYAKPIPDSVKGDRFRYMMLELEAKRTNARQRMEEARRRARERVEQDITQRQDTADQAYKERLRAVDPVWNTRHVTRRAGAVPDFNMLHSQWEQKLATHRALTRSNLTVPREFGTHNARDAVEKKAREKKALERRQRIIVDMALDAELLPEMRWPHKMPRGRVRPSPPPPMIQPEMQVADTRANILRRAATQMARKAGHFDDPHDRDRRALEKARKEARARAAAYIKMREATRKDGTDGGTQGATRAGGLGFGSGTVSTRKSQDGSVPASPAKQGKQTKTEERQALEGRTDAPAFYIEARHAQAERKAREVVEEVLLSKGPAVYNEIRYAEDK